MSLINVHTHIFNLENAPDDFVGGFVPKFLRKTAVRIVHSPGARKILIGTLKRMPGAGPKRLASFIQVGLFKRQSDLFYDLRQNYDATARFVVLSLNMDYMSTRPPKNFYDHQVSDLWRLRMHFPDRCLPFYSCDPRVGSGAELLAKVKQNVYLNSDGLQGAFVGLKLYPALGFYPFHPSLKATYDYAAENELPIMTHCTRSGAYFLGQVDGSMLSPESFCGFPRDYHEIADWDFLDFPVDRQKKNKDFCDNFLHPMNYYGVLKHYKDQGKKLKICFAHLGGVPEIKMTGNKSWYKMILFLMREFPGQVYADVSYTLYDDSIFDRLDAIISNEQYNDKLLFGTDYFMTLQEKSEKDLVGDFTRHLSKMGLSKQFQKIANDNAKRYITSKIYRCE